MSDWPVGLSTGSFYQISIFDCLDAIHKGGFSMVEVCSSPTHLNYHDVESIKKAARKMRELGMESYSFHAPFINVDISSLDQGHRQYSTQEIIRAAEAASLLESRHFVIHPGPDKELFFSSDERMQRLRYVAEVLDHVASRCAELGVGLVLENMLPHLPFGNTSDMMWIMGAMDSLNVCTCLDTGHAALSGDIYSVMFKLSGHLKVVHANDNMGSGDDHLPPGKGKIDWNKLMLELNEIEFRGGFILELTGMRNGEMEKTLEDARIAQYYLRSIMRGLYLSSPPTAPVANANGKGYR